MTPAADRRRTIRVQDLLCQAAPDASPCRSPSHTTDHTTPALSSPALSYGHYLRNYTTGTSFDYADTPSSSDLDISHSHSPQNLLTNPVPPPPHLPAQPSTTPYLLDGPPPPPQPNATSPPDHRQKAVRGPWRIEEDRLLIELVQKYGPRHWSAIATHFPRRSGKQARERWMNQLNPELKKKNWTADEDRVILRAHASLGNKWSAIANLLPGRTDNSVKNRFNSTLKRAMKERSLTTQNLNIDEFVRTLHAKPYILGHDFLLTTETGVGNGVRHGTAAASGSSTQQQSVEGGTRLDAYGVAVRPQLDRPNYINMTSGSGDEAVWGITGRSGGNAVVQGSGTVVSGGDEGMFGRHGYMGQWSGAVSGSSEAGRGASLVVVDGGGAGLGYAEGAYGAWGVNGSGGAGAVGAWQNGANAVGGGVGGGQWTEEYCPVRDRLGGRREVSPEKSISKKRH